VLNARSSGAMASIETLNPPHVPALVLGLVIFLAFGSALAGGAGGFILGFGAAFFVFFCYFLLARQYKEADWSFATAIFLYISAFQNIFLGLLVAYISPLAIQMVLALNWVLCAFLLTLFLVFSRQDTVVRDVHWCVLGVFVVIATGCGLYGFYGGALVPALAGLRNVLSPLMFFALGCLVAPRFNLRSWFVSVRVLGFLICLFGLIEYFSGGDLWRFLNIELLWLKKGLGNIADWGLPKNFVSSERIFGMQVQRMASSYADPVNFGTVLFLVFMVAWYARDRFLLLLALLCVVLTISKAAFLGLLIFVFVRALMLSSKVQATAWFLAALVAGMGFLAYSALHSTQSVAAHAGGLVAAVYSLPSFPFGRGMGNVGVLSGMDSSVQESGLGVVIGQLGLVGIVVYAGFFSMLLFRAWKLEYPRLRVLAVTLCAAIFANIAFNEVAMSPNSSAGYFVLLGVLSYFSLSLRSEGGLRLSPEEIVR